jgi:predicted transcriptional regulator
MEDDDVRALVRILKRIMSDEYLTMQGLAHRLGVATSHVSMILSGKRRPGLRFVWAAMQRYPEVRSLMTSRHAGGRERTNAPPGHTSGGRAEGPVD